LALAVPALMLAQAPSAPPPPPSSAAAPGSIPLHFAGYLGVGIQEITAERAKALKLRDEAGVEITSVIHDSPAERAGLKSGDVVVAYSGEKIQGREQFSRMVRETPIGREVKLDIIRNGAAQTIAAKVGVPRSFCPVPGVCITNDGVQRFNRQQMPMPDMPMPDVPRVFEGMHSPMLGIEAEVIEGQLAQYFGVPDGGVLVRSVLRNSPAEKAGIKAGDVILRIDESKVTSAADISARLRAAQGKSVQLAVMRERKEVTVAVTPENIDHSGDRAAPQPAK
jgi:serine protease Do